MAISIIILFLGWIAGVLINHLANALPLNETLRQVPFCKRRLNYDGSEAISTAKLGEETLAAEPVYCLSPRPARAWSALIALLTGSTTCQSCGKPMGLRPVPVELITPVLFWLLYRQVGVSIYFGFASVYAAVLVLLTVTDLEHRLIQNKVILPAILLAIIGSFFTPAFSWQQAIFGGALGFIIFYLFAWLARGGFGAGDVTLSAFLGLITGFPNVIIVLVYGILLGGLVSVILLFTRKATLKTFIPYGPFLMLSGLAMLLWSDALLAWIWR